MTVQFILPEATSLPKERKLHDRLFLVLLYNLLCKTFKDHSGTFAASSRIGAHPSLARALLPDCECKGRAFPHSLQDFHEKKCEKNPFMPILPLHSMAKPPYNPFLPSLLRANHTPPPLHSKNTSRLSLKTSPLFAASSLVSLKTSPPHSSSPSFPRTGHAPSRTYTPAHSPNFVFCLHSFTSHHNKLYISRLSVKGNPAFTFTPTATA